MRFRIGHSARAGNGWRPWGVLVPVIGLGFVAGTVISLTALLQHMGLVDAEENLVGLIGFIAFLLLPFAALGAVVIAWVRFIERRALASIGLGGEHRWRLFFGGLLTAVAIVTMITIAVAALLALSVEISTR